MIVHADFDSALERVVAGMQSRRTLNDHERRVVAFHEAGHALCAELLPGVDRVHKISIVPRGRALGYTLNLPEEDRYLKTREELIDYMTVLLGGRAAEEIVFGAITTGASDDLSRVAEISRSMVHDYAMGTTITSRRVSHEGGLVSDRTRELRDDEQQHLTDEAMRGAAKLIIEHRDKLDELARSLLENEVLERGDIDRIMDGTPRLERTRGNGLRVVAIEPTPGREAGLVGSLRLHRAVVDGLDVVAVGVEHEGAVVVLVVVRARARRAVVRAAGGEGGGVEGLDLLLGVDPEGDMAARRRRVRGCDPQVRPRDAHADHARRRLQHHAVAERLERPLIEGAAGGRVGGEELDVVDHRRILGPRWRGCRRASTWRRAITSNSSSAWPAPSATQVSAESATGRHRVSSSQALGEPVQQRAAAREQDAVVRMSEDSSGGVRSSVSRTASMIACTRLGERGAHLLGVSMTVRGRPETSSRPRSSSSIARARSGGADRELDLLRGRLADREVVLAADVGHDRLVEVVAAEPQRGLDDDLAHREHRDLARAAADVDDHVAGRLGDVEPGADRRRDRLLDQRDLARAGRQARLLDRARLDVGDPGGHAHDHPRARPAARCALRRK